MSAMLEVDDALLRAWPLPQPEPDADKEERGRVLVIAGSRETPGAAVLAAEAALRAGAGKLVVATPQSAHAIVAAALPEARVVALDESQGGGPTAGSVARLERIAAGTAAVVVGPGMQDAQAVVAFVNALLPVFAQSTVLLDALAMEAVRARGRFAREVLMTPHAGELAHLTGAPKEEIGARPHEFAQFHARDWNAVLVAKGATTCIAEPAGRLWRHDRCVTGLATSGSGDVLAGLIAGLAARGATAAQAAVWGVALHSRAGSQLARRHGHMGYLAREIAAEVPALLQGLR